MIVSSDGKILKTINNEYILLSDPAQIVCGSDVYFEDIQKHIVEPLYRVCILHDDEKPREDITEYIITDSGSYTSEYKSGLRSSLNFELDNSDGRFVISPYTDGIYYNTKFSFDVGIVCGKSVYWQPKGIFIVESVTPNIDKGTLMIQLKDKFALLDGTIGGKITSSTYFENGTNIRTIIEALLLSDKGNGKAYDSKPIIFPDKYNTMTTMYRITLSADDNIGNIILKLAELMQCDVYYNENGNLTFEINNATITNTKPVIYHFDNSGIDYFPDTSIEYNVADVVNKVVVVGGNINGSIFNATAINESPSSKINIYHFPDAKSTYVTNDNIYSDELAQDLADYTLLKGKILSIKENFNCTCIPHLDVNRIVGLSDNYLNLRYSKFILNSLTIPLSESGKYSGTMVSLEEVV